MKPCAPGGIALDPCSGLNSKEALGVDAHVAPMEMAFGRGVRAHQRQYSTPLWRAVDHEGEVLETFVTKKRDRKAAVKFLKKAMKRLGNPLEVVTDRLRSYPAAMKEIGDESGR